MAAPLAINGVFTLPTAFATPLVDPDDRDEPDRDEPERDEPDWDEPERDAPAERDELDERDPPAPLEDRDLGDPVFDERVFEPFTRFVDPEFFVLRPLLLLLAARVFVSAMLCLLICNPGLCRYPSKGSLIN